MKFTFDVSKCDRIFNELLKLGHIKLSHAILPLEELKRHAYFKGTIHSLMQLMIAMCFGDRFNRLLMKAE